jgi:nucleoside-diphosphate-sugar epimerase
MHVRAVELGEKVDGQRYLASGGVGSFQEALDIIHKNFPERKDIVAVGQPGSYKDLKHIFDNSKAIRELGIKFNSYENVVLDTLNNVKHLYKL